MLNIETPPVKRNLQYKIYWQNVKDRTLKFYQPNKGDYYSSIQLLRIIEFLAVNKHDSGLLLFSRILKLTIHGTVICQTFPCIINVSELTSLFMLLTEKICTYDRRRLSEILSTIQCQRLISYKTIAPTSTVQFKWPTVNLGLTNQCCVRTVKSQQPDFLVLNFYDPLTTFFSLHHFELSRLK